jgi:hypothetical protein
MFLEKINDKKYGKAKRPTISDIFPVISFLKYPFKNESFTINKITDKRKIIRGYFLLCLTFIIFAIPFTKPYPFLTFRKYTTILKTIFLVSKIF